MIDAQPAFVFDDGSTLTWTGSTDGGLALPDVPAGSTPWIDYREQYFSFCQFCGGYITQSISILAGEGDEALYVGSTNAPGPVDPNQLFDVAFELEPTCDTAAYGFDCHSVVDHRFDVVLDTDPVQRIPYGEVTRVDVPGGTFDVIWSNADVTSTYIPSCADGRSPIAKRDFAALRVNE